MNPLLVACVALPVVGAAHFLCSSMGYRNASLRSALAGAARVGLMLSVVSALIWVLQ